MPTGTDRPSDNPYNKFSCHVLFSQSDDCFYKIITVWHSMQNILNLVSGTLPPSLQFSNRDLGYTMHLIKHYYSGTQPNLLVKWLHGIMLNIVMHQCSLCFVIWSVQLWLKTVKRDPIDLLITVDYNVTGICLYSVAIWCIIYVLEFFDAWIFLLSWMRYSHVHNVYLVEKLFSRYLIKYIYIACDCLHLQLRSFLGSIYSLHDFKLSRMSTQIIQHELS